MEKQKPQSEERKQTPEPDLYMAEILELPAQEFKNNYNYNAKGFNGESVCKIERQNKDTFKQAKDDRLYHLQTCIMRNIRGRSSLEGK